MPNKLSSSSRRCNFIIDKSAYAVLEREAKAKRFSVGHVIRTALETVYPELVGRQQEPTPTLAHVAEAPLTGEETEKLSLLREVLSRMSVESLRDTLYRGTDTLKKVPENGPRPAQKKRGRPSKSAKLAERMEGAKSLFGLPKKVAAAQY
jgi:hypothetical protein